MPIYEYTCIKCKKDFSALQKMGCAEKDTQCPECGSNDVKKKFSAFCCSPGGTSSTATSSSAPRFTGGG